MARVKGLTQKEQAIVDREYKAGCEQLRQWYANGDLKDYDEGSEVKEGNHGIKQVQDHISVQG